MVLRYTLFVSSYLFFLAEFKVVKRKLNCWIITGSVRNEANQLEKKIELHEPRAMIETCYD